LNILLTKPKYDEVLVLVRKSTGIKHEKLTELVIDFDQLDDYKDKIAGHALFCCLGSTQRKTPDLKIYRKIDHDYPVKLAQIAKQNDVDQYHIVSSLGANSTAGSFYLKTKGKTEEDIKQVGLKCLHIYQPALLTGERKEYRGPMEKVVTVLMKVIDPLLFGSLKKHKSIPGQTVAMAMFKESINNNEGLFIHPSDNIKQIA
jgi:uncharacterized protein YbjT (DUF2867 family)